ncbi:hypothetical protein A3L12_01935 [Thermococcus sp. P6]|nr:hypothetical protein A3L12_01935 [Thermococcus sp. P6]
MDEDKNSAGDENTGILLQEYAVDGALDWLRTARRIRWSDNGKDVPEEERLYVRSQSLVSVMPVDMPLYHDEEGRIFVREDDIKRWERFERFRGMLTKRKKWAINYPERVFIKDQKRMKEKLKKIKETSD